MQYIDIDMNKQQMEYYFLRLFEKSGDANKFSLMDCTKLFLQYFVAPSQWES